MTHNSAAISPLHENDVFTDRGTIYHVAETDNPILRRATNSRPFLPLGPGDTPNGQAIAPSWKAQSS